MSPIINYLSELPAANHDQVLDEVDRDHEPDKKQAELDREPDFRQQPLGDGYGEEVVEGLTEKKPDQGERNDARPPRPPSGTA